MTHLVRQLEDSGHVVRRPEPGDGRVFRVEATHRAWMALEHSRARRVEVLRRRLAGLNADQVALLGDAVTLLEALCEEPQPK